MNGATSLKTLWEYNPTTDKWTKKADFPGAARYGAGAFVIGNAAFVGAGSASGTYQNDFYMYNPATNSWSKRADFPGSKSINITGFSVNNEGYFGNGKSGSNTLTDKFWKYNVSKNDWTAIASLPGSYRRITSSFVADNLAYVGCGTNSGTSVSTYLNDFYSYNFKMNKWTHWTSNSNFTPRISAHHFVFGDTSVYTVGGYGENGSLTGLWKLATSLDSCKYVDTTFYHDYDTTFTTVYDTMTYQVYDTTTVTIYDTIQRMIYDTTNVIIYDTSYLTIIDTSYVSIYDTTYVSVYDTMVRTILRNVDDTLTIKMYLDGCDGIEISIYPNPSSQVLNVFSRNVDCLKGKEIIMYDDIGQLVRSQTISSTITSIDLKGLAAALYFLKVVDESGNELLVKKIIVE